MQQPSMIFGLYRREPPQGTVHTHRIDALWRENLANGYNFTLLNIARDISGIGPQTLTVEAYGDLPHGAFTREAHKTLSSHEWNSLGGVVQTLPCPGLDDAVSARILEEAAQWAKYLGLHSITLDLATLEESKTVFYAELLSRLLHKSLYEGFHFWMRVPFTDQGWCRWNALRNLIGPTMKNRLHVIVDLGSATGTDTVWNNAVARWFGESIQAIALPTSLFGATTGTPQLPAGLQDICRHFHAYPNIKWLIDGPCLHGNHYVVYRDYLERLMQECPFSDLDLFLLQSMDVLQRPLQPLQDHLHSCSYESFEKDPVKYVQYEKAIRQALIDHHNRDTKVTLMVLGAGRGPLVDAAIRAADGLPCKLRILAVEKNPTAVVTLKHRIQDDWQHQDVSVIHTDMRKWQGDTLADILVSELLGSWGDNELSPECLDDVMHLMKDDGICIPCSYTSYLSPLASAKLHALTYSQAPFIFPEISARKFFETPYVVHMGAIWRVDKEQPCFTFRHPDTSNHDNNRHHALTFRTPSDLHEAILHGFRGTFDCTLYGNIHISIADTHYSEGMFCWYPLFIPLEQPLTLSGDQEFTVQVWRRVSANRVWYEWAVEGHTHIHNQGGRSSFIGLN